MQLLSNDELIRKAGDLKTVPIVARKLLKTLGNESDYMEARRSRIIEHILPFWFATVKPIRRNIILLNASRANLFKSH